MNSRLLSERALESSLDTLVVRCPFSFLARAGGAHFSPRFHFPLARTQPNGFGLLRARSALARARSASERKRKRKRKFKSCSRSLSKQTGVWPTGWSTRELSQQAERPTNRRSP